jgi:predicted transcriptional regulator
MRTVTLDVRPLRETLDNFVHVWQTGEASSPRISFESPALLFKVLTGKRWELLNALTGAGPVTIREAARRVARDVKAVHGDVHALLNVGILSRTDDGRVVFPFDDVHVDFKLKAA